MGSIHLHRRHFLAGSAALAASSPFARLHAQASDELPKIPIPPPISSGERLARLANARGLMAKNGIGAIIVE
jgi:Xaa-Pro dipeptidase